MERPSNLHPSYLTAGRLHSYKYLASDEQISPEIEDSEMPTDFSQIPGLTQPTIDDGNIHYQNLVLNPHLFIGNQVVPFNDNAISPLQQVSNWLGNEVLMGIEPHHWKAQSNLQGDFFNNLPEGFPNSPLGISFNSSSGGLCDSPLSSSGSFPPTPPGFINPPQKIGPQTVIFPESPFPCQFENQDSRPLPRLRQTWPPPPPMNVSSLRQSPIPDQNLILLDILLGDALRCPFPKCKRRFGGGQRCRMGNLKRHIDSVHKNKRWLCSAPGCGKPYARSDTLRDHQRKRHGLADPIPRRRRSSDDG